MAIPHTVRTVLKPNRKIIETEAQSTSLTNVYINVRNSQNSGINVRNSQNSGINVRNSQNSGINENLF